ncbi:aspartate ammonia-lyase [Reichenbachiella ulvae]|uniref:Aspartate ammonia-lyase n=2 Tax=Reichenbachiella ulvae TaxID=2980104 RepID=A0ABT3CNV0_9BACT|nr:aspartate ammonia-lyase [Reichenbachiella ulvae]MCV9385292.1 aspartate ammonia-lyase [Reichenbachiella ulvae]
MMTEDVKAKASNGKATPYRKEEDFLGEIKIPNQAYYGVQTRRAMDNFQVTGIPISHEPFMIEALGYVKKAAARANVKKGVLDPELGQKIEEACDLIISGRLNDHFCTDLIQGGAGTSINMNANEVIANVVLENMGYDKGNYDICHPNNHVNCSQSTNDVYPTAFRIALLLRIDAYIKELKLLANAMAAKAREFRHVLKMGRTQLQDAVPMSLGDEFKGWSITILEEVDRLSDSKKLIQEINMGATAIGTKVNAPEGYPELVTRYLTEITGLPLKISEDLIEATSDTGAYVQLSGVMKRSAVKISKICNDLRLLSSGPRTGLNEINLPRLQPGSSIMPGKVNPVIPEMVNQTAYYVIGADVTVTMASEAGQLQLNVMEPVIAFSLFTSIQWMTNACSALRSKCIDGITANEDHCREMVMNSIGIVTLLNPLLGYKVCSSIAKEALETGKSIYDLTVKEKKLVNQSQWDQLFSPDNLMNPQYVQKA